MMQKKQYMTLKAIECLLYNLFKFTSDKSLYDGMVSTQKLSTKATNIPLHSLLIYHPVVFIFRINLNSRLDNDLLMSQSNNIFQQN